MTCLPMWQGKSSLSLIMMNMSHNDVVTLNLRVELLKARLSTQLSLPKSQRKDVVVLQDSINSIKQWLASPSH